jgi:hypothetical protein
VFSGPLIDCVLMTVQHAAFAIFDKDDNGDISKKEMREAVQRIYRERKDLVSSLKVRLLETSRIISK